MRTIWRTPASRDIALVCLADGLVGASFGAIAVSTGLPLWVPVVMSVVVFAGAAQFVLVGVLAAGGNPIAAVASALLVNVRLVPLGFSIGDMFDGSSRLRMLVGSHLITDETVAFTTAEKDPHSRRTSFWLCGIGLFVSWNIGVLGGALLGTSITDTAALGLDAAFPAVIVALVMPALREKATRSAAVVGAAIAVAAAAFLPPGVPVLLALAAVPLLAKVGR
ncbi:AzlC family ABC transporter permease [Rhodococcoides kyotonense]|uniref:4-azaleucine resistance probable transporter AzlC n=1 Tax=Rhodococcoides kyotonense TaxID=398843 RepID=A0A239L8Y4_9NOCA|nr:AzlC family ABC transporter permease [Rhodococcus kyotonensis]SNT25994.1 4-azaleucine resistance probable transporter AzlC [Rhodococcus kyotonensis]